MKRSIRRAATLALVASVTGVFSTTFGDTPSFPGAQGFGAVATGNRALKNSTDNIYVVTNLNDSGTGSFRDAVSASNRIIVFAVSGQINLSSAISAKSNLTILGQTAPGQGITLQGHELSFDGQQNDIVQYIRAREGAEDSSAKASINLGSTTNMILDHVSAEYSQYDNIDAVGSNGVANITLQNSLLADPIHAQYFNMHTEGNNVSYIGNLWANSGGRNPLAKSNSQFVNNVVYNYGYAFTTGNSAGTFNYDILNNYFISGANGGTTWFQLDSNQSAYASGNMADSNKNGVLDGSSTTPTGLNILASEYYPSTQDLPLLTAAQSVAFTEAHAGDLFNNGNGTFGRDEVDSQIVTQVQSLGTSGGKYNSEKDTGNSNNGWGADVIAKSPANTLDAVPFAWLTAHGLSTADANGLLLKNALGYLMIEQYAYEIADQYANHTWSNASGSWTAGSWSSAAPGAYDHALIRGTGTANGAVTLNGSASVFSVSIGGNGPAAGESLTMTGGSLAVQDTITVGDQNNGTLNVSGGNIRTVNVQLGNTVWAPDGSSSTTYTGTLNLTGGTLALQQLVLGGGTPGNWNTGGVFNWNGGTLQATGNLIVNVPATLGANGATLDSNGFNGTLSGVLSGPGALTKIGAGTITLLRTNAYAGGTTISSGAIRAHTSGALGTGTVHINAGNGLQLDNGITLPNNIVVATGATEFVDIPTANASATLAGNISVTGSNQYRLGLSGSGATLTLTGASTTSSYAIITRGNIVFAGNGSLIDSSQAVTIGRYNSASTASFTVQDNAVVQGKGIQLGGLSSSLDDSAVNVTTAGNATLSAGTSPFNLNNSATGGTVTLNVNGASTLQAGSFSAGGANQGQTTINFNGGTILAAAADSASPFFPALASVSATIQPGGLTVNDGGFGITVAQPLAGTGPLTKTGPGTLTLTGANSFTGPTTINAGTLAIGPSGALAGTSLNVAHGATLTVLAGGSISVSVNLTSNGTVTLNASRTINSLNGAAPDAALHLNAATLTIAGGGNYAGLITDDGSHGGLTVNTAMSVGSAQVASLSLNKNLQIHATSSTASLNLLGAANTWTTGLDLAGNALVFNSASKAGDIATLQSELAYGLSHNAGLYSSAALPANVAYAVVDNAALATPYQNFRGVGTGSNSLLVAPFLQGDANADGSVTAEDLQIVLNHFGQPTTAWTSGNFAGDPTIDLTDLSYVLNNMNLTYNPTSGTVSTLSAPVPEPASLTLLLPALALLHTRRCFRPSAR